MDDNRLDRFLVSMVIIFVSSGLGLGIAWLLEQLLEG